MSPAADTLAEDYAALRHGAGAVELDRDFVTVAGPQALEYLQGQLSQDVEALAPGGSALSLLLEPQGKVSAFLRVTRLVDDELLLDFDAGHAEAVVARLARFKLRTKVDIGVRDGWRCLAVRGPRAAELLGGRPVPTDDTVRAVFTWPGLEGVDLLGPAPELPEGIWLCGPAAYDARRIEAGLPVMGAELDERTIPEESGAVAASVSFTKGCYTGQELVARIDSRGGNVARRLRGVVGTSPGAADGSDPDTGWEPGAVLSVEGAEVGRLTSVAWSPELGTVGLAYIRRGREVPFRAELAGGPGAEVRALPLAPAG